ncbi:hypothetical protein C8R34_10747 [Nitrosomonas sp. Nm84]|uniref:hypothetical protein n=1 Tax=Nitrosomonas sp. Nm84 TaxID=200124 RepID=UPI000D76C6F2|nr:hypothetical protein [Nitrosomonas sp. Nm84]PXW88364.1 hypothetical protein C8R34_10747 [Nitrosomonas sp. Nm84]
MGAYRLLLSVTVEHAYFSGKNCEALEFIPTGSCAKLLRKVGLLLKSSESGIAVYYDEEKIDILRLHAEDELTLDFKVFSRDSSFFCYTNPGAPPDSAILFFNNQRITQDAEGKQMLHSDPNVTERAWMDMTEGLLREMLDQKDYFVKPAFILQMLVTADEQGLCSEKPDAAARKFYIRFTTNQAFWKYYILGDLSKRNVYIADLDNKIPFENIGNIVLPGQREAVLLQSSVAIPMQEQYAHRLQLKESGSMGDKVLIKRLPNASVSQMVGEVMNGRMENISEIYVN